MGNGKFHENAQFLRIEPKSGFLAELHDFLVTSRYALGHTQVELIVRSSLVFFFSPR